MAREDEDTARHGLPVGLRLTDEAQARRSIADAIQERLEPERMKSALTQYMGSTLAPFQNRMANDQTFHQIRSAVAGVLREYVLTLAARGLIPEDAPLPISVGEVTKGKRMGSITIGFNVDPRWLDSLPPDVREEIGALMAAKVERERQPWEPDE
jgi:hypothetical protein